MPAQRSASFQVPWQLVHSVQLHGRKSDKLWGATATAVVRDKALQYCMLTALLLMSWPIPKIWCQYSYT